MSATFYASVEKVSLLLLSLCQCKLQNIPLGMLRYHISEVSRVQVVSQAKYANPRENIPSSRVTLRAVGNLHALARLSLALKLLVIKEVP